MEYREVTGEHEEGEPGDGEDFGADAGVERRGEEAEAGDGGGFTGFGVTEFGFPFWGGDLWFPMLSARRMCLFLGPLGHFVQY